MGSQQWRQAGLHGPGEVIAAPIAGQCGVKHVAEPMEDHRLVGLGQHARVDGEIVLRTSRDARQCAACHEDNTTAELLDRVQLVEIGADDVVDRASIFRIELVGAAARIDHRATIPSGGEGAGDELASVWPIETHAALGGVHGFGDRKALVEQIGAKAESLVPIDCGRAGRIIVGQRIGDDMGRGKGDAVPGGRTGRRDKRRADEAIRLDFSGIAEKGEGGHGLAFTSLNAS